MNCKKSDTTFTEDGYNQQNIDKDARMKSLFKELSYSSEGLNSKRERMNEILINSLLKKLSPEEWRSEYLQPALESDYPIDFIPAFTRGWTILYTALYYKQSEKVFEILKAGADVNIQDFNGYNALMLAVKFRCDLNVVDAILPQINNINAIDKVNETAFSIACTNYIVYGKLDLDVIGRLLKAGADPYLNNEWQKDFRYQHIMMQTRYKKIKTYVLTYMETRAAIQTKYGNAYEYEL